MLKVTLWDKSCLFVQDHVKEVLYKKMASNEPFLLKHLGNQDGDALKGNAIARISLARYGEYAHLLVRHNHNLLTDKTRPELTEEQRAENLHRLAKMKSEIIRKRRA